MAGIRRLHQLKPQLHALEHCRKNVSNYEHPLIVLKEFAMEPRSSMIVKANADEERFTFTVTRLGVGL